MRCRPAAPRVLVLAVDPFGVGGIERFTRVFLHCLQELFGPDEVGLVSLGSLRSHDPGCRVLHAGTSQRLGFRKKVRYLAASLRAAHRWREGLVVVACHSRLAPVAWLCRFVTGAPYLVWCYGKEVWRKPSRSVRLGLGRADVAVAISEFTAAAVAEQFRPKVLRIIHPCVFPPFTGTGAMGSGEKADAAVRPRVITVARLDAGDSYKAVDTLLCAWPRVLDRVPDAELLVVGEGSARRDLERLARQVGVQGRVRFVGRLSDPELCRAYRAADVFAMPGRAELGPRAYGEGFGIVFVEAAAIGLPVVAGRAGGAPEAMVEGVTGLLVDPLDPEDVAGAVSSLLLDPALARRMGAAGMRVAAERFSYPVFRDKVGHLFGSIRKEASPCAGSSECSP
ncbi:MAG: glycosyltransferase family 4 protein [Actinobacteria bacterium]|nr:MAG: glycosyltransferase family 4 protein [Actinomycetota bacterium]